MRTRRFAGVAIAAALVVGGVPALAGAHGGPGHHGRHYGPKVVCTVPADQQLTVETSPLLARLKERLDQRVADGRITQQRADERFAAAVTRLSVHSLVAEARWKPLLDLLGTDLEGLKAARKEGKGILDLAKEKGVTMDQLIAAFREGRTAARDLRAQLCPRPTPPVTKAPEGSPEGTTT